MASNDSRSAAGADLFADSSSNNLDLVRLIAAVMVIYGHSFAISPVAGHVDLVTRVTNGLAHSGSVAVATFFFLSGILVARSAVQSSTPWSFLLKRLARIWPALIVCVLLSAFVFAPLFGGGEPDVGQLFSYVAKNIGNVYNQHFVAGVYESHPDKSLNGSLWSLTLEARLYLVIFLLMLMGVHKTRPLLDLILIGLVVHLAVDSESVILLGSNVQLYGVSSFPRNSAIFLLGAIFFLKGGGRLNFLPAAIIFFFGYSVAPSGVLREAFFWAFVLFVVLSVARNSMLLRVKLPGDYSYGVYLYGWPSQQIVYTFFPGAYPELNFVLASALALILASLSWHLLERRVLYYVRSGVTPTQLISTCTRRLSFGGGAAISSLLLCSSLVNDGHSMPRENEASVSCVACELGRQSGCP